MCSHEVLQRGATADLAVELETSVLLVGLLPVYAHGLRVGLTAAGLRCTVRAAADGIDPPADPGQTVVAVVPADLGPAVTGDSAARVPAVHVLADASTQAYADALRAGATGAFAHDAEMADIARTVLCAGRGLTLLPVGVARALNRRPGAPPPELDGPELQYLRMLADGATVASVGRRFGYSEREMFRLLSATYERLGAHNRTEALLLAQRFGMLDEQP